MSDEYTENFEQQINYINLIAYFLANFRKILKPEDFTSKLQSKITEITDTPEQQTTKPTQETFPGERGYSFVFKEDSTFNGCFDVDFINGALAHFRAQLFAGGLLSTLKIQRKYNSALKFIDGNYRPADDELFIHDYDRVWYDEVRKLVIAIRKVKDGPRQCISLSIVDERYA